MELYLVCWIFSEDKVGARDDKVLMIFIFVGSHMNDSELSYILAASVMICYGKPNDAPLVLPDKQAKSKLPN